MGDHSDQRAVIRRPDGAFFVGLEEGVVDQIEVTAVGGDGRGRVVARSAGWPISSSTVRSAVQFWPPSVEVVKNTCSLLRPSRPSTQVRASWSVASVPVGAPLAMSTLGALDRSLLAPAMPSMVVRPSTGSRMPVLTDRNSRRGASKLAPLSTERAV
jgi:hypothetical protein